MDNNGTSIGGGGDRSIPTSSRTLDVSKMSLVTSQAGTSSKNNYPFGVSSGSVVMLTDSLHNSRTASMLVPMSGSNPITILPLSSKIRMSQKSMKSVPKITVNNSASIQRTQRINRPLSPVRKQQKINTDFDDDLGNILDIPIIFAKDGENINAIEKSPPISQIPIVMDTSSYDKNVPKLNSGTTKVVLISNKQDRMQPGGNVANIRAAGPQHHINRTILQNRAQNQSIATTGRVGTPMQTVSRLNQPTIKYTKIILAKRNSYASGSANNDDKTEQVILTKNNSKIVNYDKNEHRYAQVIPRHQIKFQEIIQDDSLEIEDAIKTNIIERKVQAVPDIDLNLPSKNGHSIEEINSNLDLNTEMEMEIVKTDAFLSDSNVPSEINEQQ